MPQHGHKQHGGEAGVDADIFHRVGNRVMLLSHEVTNHHSGSITSESAPRASHIAILGHEDEVDGEKHGATHKREHCAPDGFVDEFIPE